MTAMGWILFLCVMLKSFGIIDVSWWVALTPLWYIMVVSAFHTLFNKD